MAEVHNLAAATTTLLERAAAAPAGQAALTLVASAGAALRRTLQALGACSWPNTTPVGGDAPGPVGPRAAETSEASWDEVGATTYRLLRPGTVESLEDAGVLLTVAATPYS
jgi:hypothetical protein